MKEQAERKRRSSAKGEEEARRKRKKDRPRAEGERIQKAKAPRKRGPLREMAEAAVDVPASVAKQFFKTVRNWNKRGVPQRLIKHVLQNDPFSINSAFCKCRVCSEWTVRSAVDDGGVCPVHWGGAGAVDDDDE